ncbi:MAG TPA: hypothetical protein VIL85_19370 [Thermomicrobiales bacterium]|jgi:hypothetical protein
MTSSPPRSPHALLPLLPQFLARRRRGYAGVPALLDETGLSRPAFFMLVRVAERGAPGGTAARLRPGEPYSTRDTHLGWLDEAVAGGFLARSDDHLNLTPRGRAIVTRLETEAVAYLASLRPLPDDELVRLADHFSAIAAGLDDRAGGPDAHIHYAARIAAFAPAADTAPLARLERALLTLWMARDDAHIGAWQIARFPAPHLSILTELWQGEVDTLEDLITRLAAIHEPAMTAELVEELTEQGYVELKAGALQPTRAGYNVREAIESDTDELYFRQWPPLDPDTLDWLYDALSRTIAALPDNPRSQQP